ncbi:MAG TPA: transporter substrate-binding domain-containing protein [Gaiellaceae bacterium]|nr:transporter substrate-binding domain-containing protein [Gaiellaceae bacterium]
MNARLRAACVAAVSILAVAGCNEQESPVAQDELTKPGVLRICSDPTRPPMEYRGRDGVLRGFEIDLLDEIANRVDLRPVWVDTSRSRLVDAVVEGRCDVIASSLPVDFEDQKAIREIAYLGVPISLLVLDGAEPPLARGLCGRPIGAFAGTRQSRILAEYSDVCERAGRPPVDEVAVNDVPEALSLVESGRIDGLLDEVPLVGWYSRLQTDTFDDGGTLPVVKVDYAIGCPAGRDSVFWGVRLALQTINDDGTFVELLHRWGLDEKGVEGLALYS